ncbi:N-formylglutamate amidohydrolase [Akkermansiaceae bacterium]|nr:N-formylglutamate amidohydrolase [Akkermansiaceae bacterium]
MISLLAQNDSTKLILAQSGDLPIVLSAPHGGGLAIEGVPVRRGQEVSRFVTKKDMWTDQLTLKLADALEKKTGKRPYVVVAKFHRKFIDANRSADLAYESPEAKSTYDAYHEALASARREVLRRWGSGILFDIHGQAVNSKAIYRGTQNGETTAHLVKKFGREALAGESSVFGQIARQGIEVIPALGLKNKETRFTGGYVVRTYGSDSMNAIQLELGRDLRSPKNNSETAKKLANATVAFSKEYLPQKELSKEGRARK